MIPDRLAAALADRYRLERELGQGGMATVYLAHDLKHDRRVAIKVLRPELAAVLGADRFVVEIKTTAALQHPHILPLFDSGSADGFLYYVMPFIDGETLRAKLDRETQFDIEEAVKITVAVADALDYAHRHGVIHRDIKPENILLHDGRPMVADFGIALALSAAAGGRMTETGLSLGTPHYMSPEQATAEKEITARSDVYSLGSVLYEMLTGNPPHTGASAQQIIMKIVTEEAAPVTRLRKSVPPHVAAALAKALEKLPADRFGTANAFAEALGNPAFVASSSTQGGSRGGAPEGPWKRRTLVASAAALLLLVPAFRGWQRPASAEVDHPWRVRIVLPDSAPVGDVLSLSGDGSVLVYDGGGRLWMRTADATGPVPIPGSEGGDDAALSPDGKRVTFLRNASIVVQALDGGSPQTVATGAVGSPLVWTDDEHIVYTSMDGLRRVSVVGGETQRLTIPDTASHDVLHVEAAALPGGGTVFTTAGRSSDSTAIAAVGPEGGRVSKLMTGVRAVFAPPGHLIVTLSSGSIVAVPFDVRGLRTTGAPVTIATGLHTGNFTSTGRVTVARNGRLIYVAGGWGRGDDPSDVVWVSGGRVTAVDEGWIGAFDGVALSPDGRRAAVGLGTDRGQDLLVRDLASGSVARVSVNGTLLKDPVFAPGGRQLYFAGLGASHGLHRVDAGGAAPPELIDPTAFVGIGHTAIDGSGNLLFSEGAAGLPRIFRHSLSRGSPDSAVTPPGVMALRPQVSPDGHWMAYLSASAGAFELHVRSTDPGRTEDWRVAASVDPESSLHWSRAGDALYYVAVGNMMAAPVRTTPSFQAGTPRVLFAITGLKPVFDVAPDGRFLMLRWRPKLRPPTELVMLERWTDLLPR